MHDLTGFQRDCMYVIASDESGPLHGLGVKNALEQYYSQEIHHGRLYPNLDTLVAKGLVEKGSIDDRTNSYVITERGKREIKSRREWENDFLRTSASAPDTASDSDNGSYSVPL